MQLLHINLPQSEYLKFHGEIPRRTKEIHEIRQNVHGNARKDQTQLQSSCGNSECQIISENYLHINLSNNNLLLCLLCVSL